MYDWSVIDQSWEFWQHIEICLHINTTTMPAHLYYVLTAVGKKGLKYTADGNWWFLFKNRV